MPKDRRETIEHKEEIFGILKQSHISAKNVSRLNNLRSSADNEVSQLASIVLEIAEVVPYKKRRLAKLAHDRRDLLMKLESTGLIWAHHFS